jgi:hypothetical protein
LAIFSNIDVLQIKIKLTYEVEDEDDAQPLQRKHFGKDLLFG